jgi:signal transduction histidine kinase
MRLIGSVRDWAERHPDVAELAIGAAAAILVLLVSLIQWGATDTGLSRGVSLGLPLAAITVWVYRRRRLKEERRQRAFLEQRLQLARELHDSVAGQVAIVGIQAAAARRVLITNPDEAAAALERIETSSRSAVGDLRRMLTALREGAGSEPPGAAPGLARLTELLDDFRRSGLRVDLTTEGPDAIDLPPALDQALYRIAQEALTNALKHGPAKSAHVELVHREDAIELRVTNPSVDRVRATTGTDRPHPAPASGLGVKGLRERVAVFDGEAFIGPVPDGLWLVDVRLPIGPEGGT